MTGSEEVCRIWRGRLDRLLLLTRIFIIRFLSLLGPIYILVINDLTLSIVIRWMAHSCKGFGEVALDLKSCAIWSRYIKLDLRTVATNRKMSWSFEVHWLITGLARPPVIPVFPVKWQFSPVFWELFWRKVACIFSTGIPCHACNKH